MHDNTWMRFKCSPHSTGEDINEKSELLLNYLLGTKLFCAIEVKEQQPSIRYNTCVGRTDI